MNIRFKYKFAFSSADTGVRLYKDVASGGLKPKVNVKVNLYCNQSWRHREQIKRWASLLTLIFGTARMAELSAVCASSTLP
jgi:hypothetical protein